MLDNEQSARDIEAAIERLLALGHRPCPTCNPETVTSRDGSVVSYREAQAQLANHSERLAKIREKMAAIEDLGGDDRLEMLRKDVDGLETSLERASKWSAFIAALLAAQE